MSKWEKFNLWLRMEGRNLSRDFTDELIMKVGIIQQDAFNRGIKEGKARERRDIHGIDP